MGFRASAEMLLIFRFPVNLELTSNTWISAVLFHFLYVAFFPTCYLLIHFYLCSETHKSSYFFFRIHNFKRLLEKSSDSPVIEEFPFEVQLFLSSNLKGSYISVMDS